MSIFCIGQSAFDMIMPMHEPIVANRKYRMYEKYECAGGPALNAAYLCALWGADVYLVSRMGKDEYGRKLRDILNHTGVHLEYMIKDDEITTPHSYIFSNTVEASRTLFNFPGKLKEVKYEYPDIGVDVILSDGHEVDISLGAIKKYPNAVSIIDAGTCRESTLAVGQYVDYLICSEDFARGYTGKMLDVSDWTLCEEIFEEVEKINGKHVIITLGDKGLLYRKEGKLIHMPAYHVLAVDTNGAGDVFHGAFAFGIMKKMELTDILKLSSMAAARSVQKFGTQKSIPKLQEVQKDIEIWNV